jgi:hypothetical protein
MQLKKIEAQAITNKLQIEYRQKKHNYGLLKYKGKPILPVYFSHGRGDMPGNVPDKFRQSLKLNENDFENLKNCPLSREDYIEILKEKGLIR